MPDRDACRDDGADAVEAAERWLRLGWVAREQAIFDELVARTPLPSQELARMIGLDVVSGEAALRAPEEA